MPNESHRGQVVVSTYLPAHEAETLRRRAANGDRSIAAEVRRVLRPVLKDEARGGDGALATTLGEEVARHEAP